MNKKPLVILVTSSINVYAPFTVITNSLTRLEQLYSSLYLWLKFHPEFNYVICDGSGYDFSNNIFTNTFKNVEFISFQNSIEIVKVRGKGYGEGEIIKYALNHSLFLKESNFFCKITGRLFVNHTFNFTENNSHQLICSLKLKYKYFIIPISEKLIDTRFYYVNKEFFLKYFIEIYKYVDDKNNYYLEKCFYDKVKELLIEGNNIKFHEFFPIIGQSGSTGSFYKKSSIFSYFINLCRYKIYYYFNQKLI